MNGKQAIRRIFLLLPVASIAFICTFARADVSLRWQTTESSLPPLLASYLTESNVISDFVAMIDENFIFEQPLVLELGARSGPEYDAASNTIRMPYSFLERAVFTQSVVADEVGDGDGENSNAVERGIDVLEYTLYHLLGHSLISNASENSDNTVEAISTYIMLAYWPNGAEQWAADVEAFGAVSQSLDGPLSDYWQSHSLYEERQQTLECWIRGSLLVQEEVWQASEASTDQPTDKALYEASQQCLVSWNNLAKASRLMLEPFLRTDSTLGRTLGL